MKIHKLKDKDLAILDFELLELSGGEKRDWNSGEFEAVLVLLEGSLEVEVLEVMKLSRKNVFDDKPAAVFVGPNTSVKLAAASQSIIAICKAKSDQSNPPFLISPEMTTEEWRGKEGYKRKIRNIVGKDAKTQRIGVGETISLPGNWSSFPPHKHDEEIPGKEVPLEEIYFFRIRPENGFAMQRIYTRDGRIDECFAVKDKDCVFIPKGYHPVANLPGHELYYLWILAGNQRIFIWNVDPDFKWLE